MHPKIPGRRFAPPKSDVRGSRIRFRVNKTFLFFALFALPFCASADIILSDNFAYTNGPLAVANSNVWTTYTGTANQINVVNGRASLSSLNSEGVSAQLTNGPYASGALYASFVVNFSFLPT